MSIQMKRKKPLRHTRSSNSSSKSVFRAPVAGTCKSEWREGLVPLLLTVAPSIQTMSGAIKQTKTSRKKHDSQSLCRSFVFPRNSQSRGDLVLATRCPDDIHFKRDVSPGKERLVSSTTANKGWGEGELSCSENILGKPKRQSDSTGNFPCLEGTGMC